MNQEMSSKETSPVDSPVGSDDNLSPKISRFGRLRKSFRTLKEGKDNRGSLKRKVEEIQQENDELREKLQEALQERDKLSRRLKEVISSHQYFEHVDNLHIGESNTNVVTGTDTSNLDEIERMITKLTAALETDMNQRAKLAMDNENTKIQLKELKEMISEQYQKLQTRMENGEGLYEDLKTFFCELQSDRSDKAVIGDCLSALQSVGSQRFVVDFESLPPRAKPGIARLVHKFGSMSWKGFVSRFGLDPRIINTPSYPVRKNLDKDVCTLVLVEWVKRYGDAIDTFMDCMKTRQQELQTDLKREYQTEIIGHRSGQRQFQFERSLPRGCSTESIVTTITRTERTERMERTERKQAEDTLNVEDQLQQIIDMIKGIPYNTTMLEDIKKKVDAMYKDGHWRSSSMQYANQPSNTQTMTDRYSNKGEDMDKLMIEYV